MKNQLSIILILFCTTFMVAQKGKIQEGDWKNLKGITKYNLVFDYSNLEIPKYDNEEEFLKDKMKKREDKEAGAGERFKESWFADRENRYEPKFIESFNKRWKENEIVVDRDFDEAEHTIKIHTTFLYAGYNVGVMRQNSKVDAILTVYKNDAPDKVLFEIKYTKAEGKGAFGNDFDSGYRISEAYAKLAKTFAANLKKKTK
ncbi:hypothetical protein [Oceanihabitans sediminis]|uniref:Uncharacterized protein n=1 Tax=Oceanihabitans sediminis TaxID=1812012 RepID=A0A368P7W5_9FLAO|nr:hypothetical protein [Oceanihabitans sediminis]MDX1277509.1 hypothetical protein [Oceanihabitans sediminis]MDX1772850.1 hypothetical protein [Oceanihabitans sediminis]RBP34528.1 hypothetical protein DFR65_101422 [Oceanihabitans sediminis]RCU58194.1 hypothetical protein DU428_02095 [Oceanihabitans sediminis]